MTNVTQEDKIRELLGPFNGPEDPFPRPVIASCYYLGLPLPENTQCKYQPSHYLGNPFAKSDDVFSEIIYRLGEERLDGYKVWQAHREFQRFTRRFKDSDVLKYTSTDLAVYYTDWLLFARKQGWSYGDYFNYEGYNKEISVRNTFLNHADWVYYFEAFNKGNDAIKIARKTSFNETFRDFLKRDWLNMSKSTYEDFKEFVSKHPRFFAKPVGGTGGIGSAIFDASEKSVDELYKICVDNNMIVEELVTQYKELAKINESSLNTVRIETLHCADGVVRPMLTLARFGRKGKVADNFHSEGVGGLVDIETGVINTPITNRTHSRFTEHPDSHIQLTGMTYPLWDKLVDTAKRAAMVIPECRNVGWDLAVREDGEIELIEGNTKPGFDVLQSADNRGKYDRFAPYIPELEKMLGLPVNGGSYYTHHMEDIDITGMTVKNGVKYKDIELIGNIPMEIFHVGYKSVHHDPVPRRHADIKPRYIQVRKNEWAQTSPSGSSDAVISICGDVMCQNSQQVYSLNTYGEPNYDENVRMLSYAFADSDFCVGNLETLVDDETSYLTDQIRTRDIPRTNTSSIFLDALRLGGFDMLVTANNHNCDCGIEGIKRTVDKLDEYGFINTGLFRSPEESRWQIVNINGIRVGILSYTTKFNGFNYFWTATARSTFLHRYSLARLKKEIQQLKMRGAEFIIAYNHWGKEGSPTASEDQKKTAREMAEAGVDFIAGSHTHCLQQFDNIKTKDGRTVPVIYSLGNFLSGENVANYINGLNVYVSSIFRLTLTKKNGKAEIKDLSILPTRRINEWNNCFNTVLPALDLNDYDDETRKALVEARKYAQSIIGDKVKLYEKSL